MGLTLVFTLCVVLLAYSQGKTQAARSSSESGSSSDSSNNASVGFYNVMTQQTQKSYLVGIRTSAKGENVCYGVLIAPKYVLTAGCKQTYYKVYPVLTPKSKFKYAVVGGSRYNSGSHDDESETIRIASYKECRYYSSTGERAVSVYVLSKTSTLTPLDLPMVDTVDLANGTTHTIIGWSKSDNGKD